MLEGSYFSEEGVSWDTKIDSYNISVDQSSG